MSYTILKTFSKEDLDSGFSLCQIFYIEDDNIRLSFSPNAMYIIELSNALKRGQRCPKIIFRNESDSFFDDVKEIFTLFSYSAGDVYKSLVTLSKENDFEPVDIDNFTVYFDILEGVRVFSPFAFSHLKPLNALPKKWTIPHVIRALANDQFTDLRCDGEYTDDYASDAQTDCNRGPREAMTIIYDLVKDVGSWRTYLADDGRVRVCCYTFNNNSFVPNLE